jgi:hypothetical protein
VTDIPPPSAAPSPRSTWSLWASIGYALLLFSAALALALRNDVLGDRLDVTRLFR